MSYLVEVVTKAQDWRKRLKALASEMEDIEAAPSGDIRPHVAGVLSALEDARSHVEEAVEYCAETERLASRRHAETPTPIEDKTEQAPIANPQEKK